MSYVAQTRKSIPVNLNLPNVDGAAKADSQI